MVNAVVVVSAVVGILAIIYLFVAMAKAEKL